MGTISLVTSALIFTTIVLFDQLVIITNRLSTIERIRLFSNRLGKRVKKRGYDNFKYTFGGPFGFHWFLPFAPKVELTVESLYK